MNKDKKSVLLDSQDPSNVTNFNNPHLDLDTVYDFDGNEAGIQHGKFVIGTSVSGMEVDYPRDNDGTARIADPRNDNTKIIAQIQMVSFESASILSHITISHCVPSHVFQVLMLHHNKRVDEYLEEHHSGNNNGKGDGNGNVFTAMAFAHAREETILTWQSIILYDLLPQLVANEVIVSALWHPL